jgi:hypothetical protein
VTINLGRDRGARILQIFEVYKEDPPGSGTGTPVGKILIKEVSEDTCTGPYYPDTRDQPTLGMLVVAQEAIRARLVEPTNQQPGRFLEFHLPSLTEPVPTTPRG